MWRTSNEKRIERSGWASFGPQQEQTTSIPSMAAFRRIAERNQAKARIRYLRARRLDSHEDDGEVWGEDSLLDEPSADESLPPKIRIFSLPYRLNSHCPWRVLIHDCRFPP